MSTIILPKIRTPGNSPTGRPRPQVLRDLSDEKPTLFQLMYSPYVPAYPEWRERRLTEGRCRYAKWAPEGKEPIVWRVEIDPEPESGQPLVALLRHRPHDNQTRKHIPWDLLVYETFQTEPARDARADEICCSLPIFWDGKVLTKVAHPEDAL